MLGRSGCDVVASVRGGGGRGDLAAFESEVVARAVAGCGVQVWTGIGHTGDQSGGGCGGGACVSSRRPNAGRRSWRGHGAVVGGHVAGPAAVLAGRVPSFLSDGVGA